jgi:hypothetical protein
MEVYSIILRKEHLSEEGLEKIRTIAKKINGDDGNFK